MNKNDGRIYSAHKVYQKISMYDSKKTTRVNVPITYVMVDGKALRSFMLPEGTPKTFEWGYHGIYPYNLAVSVLCDVLDIDDYRTLFTVREQKHVFDSFYSDFICDCHVDRWALTERNIISYMMRVVKKMESKEDREKIH